MLSQKNSTNIELNGIKIPRKNRKKKSKVKLIEVAIEATVMYREKKKMSSKGSIAMLLSSLLPPNDVVSLLPLWCYPTIGHRQNLRAIFKRNENMLLQSSTNSFFLQWLETAERIYWTVCERARLLYSFFHAILLYAHKSICTFECYFLWKYVRRQFY